MAEPHHRLYRVSHSRIMIKAGCTKCLAAKDIREDMLCRELQKNRAKEKFALDKLGGCGYETLAPSNTRAHPLPRIRSLAHIF
jgi:hypothetical protein